MATGWGTAAQDFRHAVVVRVKNQFLVLSIEGLSQGHRERKGVWPPVNLHLTHTSLAGLERGRGRVQVGGIQTVGCRKEKIIALKYGLFACPVCVCVCTQCIHDTVCAPVSVGYTCFHGHVEARTQPQESFLRWSPSLLSRTEFLTGLKPSLV